MTVLEGEKVPSWLCVYLSLVCWKKPHLVGRKEARERDLFVAFTYFHGVITPITAHFKLPTLLPCKIPEKLTLALIK